MFTARDMHRSQTAKTGHKYTKSSRSCGLEIVLQNNLITAV